MKVDISAICDAATVESGKLNLLGVFDTLFSNNFPLTHSFCSVAFRVRLEKNDSRPDLFKLRILDDKNKEVIPQLETKVNYYNEKPDPKDPNKGNLNLTFGIVGLKIDKPGTYEIQLLENKKVIKKMPLYAKKEQRPM